MGRPQIVLLGMMTKIPVAGVVWQTLHYLVGFERLGYETYYVEAHARTPSMLMERPEDDSSARAAAFISRVLDPFGFGKRWAYHALHADCRCYGMSEATLFSLYRSAAIIINLHGGTEPRPEHLVTDRLVYLETDPVEVEIQLAEGIQETVNYLRSHCAYFTFGENYGKSDCLLPMSKDFAFQPTRQPVVADFWRHSTDTSDFYTTIGSWRQEWREIRLGGETYSWSKHQEFLKFLNVPSRTGRFFELALSGAGDIDRDLLGRHGWRVRDALSLSRNIGSYRDYICQSRGEFTVAKDQNVRLRTGWFSDRSATYLAAGRPVITQDTGFGNSLPTGEGLFAFSTVDDIMAAVESIDADYGRHSRAASRIAREYFEAEVVLGRLLDRVAMPRFPPSLAISLISRRPTTLPSETLKMVAKTPLPVSMIGASAQCELSVIVVTRDGLPFNRLCLESVLGSEDVAPLELVVVDNDSRDGTINYLHSLALRDRRLRVVKNERNVGFAPAVNQGIGASTGRRLVILNNDTIVPPHALARILVHLEDDRVGLVGPVSNEASTEAEIDVSYTTLGELVGAAEERWTSHRGQLLDVPMLTMFCVGIRREVFDEVGPLDERYQVALFEDDDYSMRVKQAGYRIVCAEDVLVHHFGEASIGPLVPTGEHASLFEANRNRFQAKWGKPWLPHGRRQPREYTETIERIRETVRSSIPLGATILVISKGDEELLKLDGRVGSHFPQAGGGVYAGHHPADSDEAIAELERHRLVGAEFLLIPRTSLWWLDHYSEFRDYLGRNCREVPGRDDACVIFDLGRRA